MLSNLLSGLIGAIVGGIFSIMASWLSSKFLNAKTEQVTQKNIENIKKLEQEKLEKSLCLKATILHETIKKMIHAGFETIKDNQFRPVSIVKTYIEDIHFLLINNKIDINESRVLFNIYMVFDDMNSRFNRERPRDEIGQILKPIYEKEMKKIFTEFAYNKILTSGGSITMDSVFDNTTKDKGLNLEYKNLFNKLEKCSIF